MKPRCVVVLRGTACGHVGWAQPGPDADRSFVRFPDRSFPNDFRVMRNDNLRDATGGEEMTAQPEGPC